MSVTHITSHTSYEEAQQIVDAYGGQADQIASDFFSGESRFGYEMEDLAAAHVFLTGTFTLHIAAESEIPDPEGAEGDHIWRDEEVVDAMNQLGVNQRYRDGVEEFLAYGQVDPEISDEVSDLESEVEDFLNGGTTESTPTVQQMTQTDMADIIAFFATTGNIGFALMMLTQLVIRPIQNSNIQDIVEKIQEVSEEYEFEVDIMEHDPQDLGTSGEQQARLERINAYQQQIQMMTQMLNTINQSLTRLVEDASNMSRTYFSGLSTVSSNLRR